MIDLITTVLVAAGVILFIGMFGGSIFAIVHDLSDPGKLPDYAEV